VVQLGLFLVEDRLLVVNWGAT